MLLLKRLSDSIQSRLVIRPIFHLLNYLHIPYKPSLGPLRRFKCYVNLKSTMPKLEWMCENYKFVPMSNLVDEFETNNLITGQMHQLPIHKEYEKLEQKAQ